MGIWSLLEGAVRDHGDRLAIPDRTEPQDYRSFGKSAGDLAGYLEAVGLEPGERISVLAENSPRFLLAYFAAAGAGLVTNPLNVRLALPELVAILGDCESRWLLADSSRAEVVGELRSRTGLEGVLWLDGAAPGGDAWDDALAQGGGFRPRAVSASDPAHIYYTSGTTGRPKGVVLTHRNVCRHAELAASELGLCASDVWGHFAPLFHLADAWATFAITASGGSHVCVPRFDAVAVLDAIERCRVTLTNVVPTMIVRLLDELSRGVRDTSSLRLLLSGGAPISRAVVDAIEREIRCEYAQTYGMTETSPYLSISSPTDETRALPLEEQRRLRARTGRAFRGVELEVVDEAGRHVSRDDEQVGEIRVRGETVSPGYWKRPEETAAAFRDGWLHTGDLAVMDGRGWIDIVDRRKDMIVTGGENVYSTEVENALFAHPAVLEAAAFGTPDDDWGERVCAAVVLRGGATATVEELVRACEAVLARYKVPRRIHLLDELPRTGSGKIEKRTLRARFGGSPDAGPR